MKIFKVLVSALLVCFVFAGCSSQSLADLTIVQGVGIDLDNSDTLVTLQYLNLTKGSGSTDSLSGNITTTADGESSSISDALSSASKNISKEIFFGQNKLIVFGQDYANESVEMGMDYLLRSVSSRPDVIVAMSSDKASDIIKSEERDARVPAENVYNLLKHGEENGLGAIVTVNDLLNMYSDKTSDIYLPALVTKDKIVYCDGIAIFSNEKYQTTLNQNQTFGFLFVNNKIKGGAITVKNDELGRVGVEILSSKTKKSMTVKNGRLTLNCSVKSELILDEIENGITAAVDEKKINQIEKLVNKKIKNMCSAAINECFKYKSDPFMLGKYLAMSDVAYYDSVKDNWRDSLSDIDVIIDVQTELVKVNDNSVRE